MSNRPRETSPPPPPPPSRTLYKNQTPLAPAHPPAEPAPAACHPRMRPAPTAPPAPPDLVSASLEINLSPQQPQGDVLTPLPAAPRRRRLTVNKSPSLSGI